MAEATGGVATDFADIDKAPEEREAWYHYFNVTRRVRVRDSSLRTR